MSLEGNLLATQREVRQLEAQRDALLAALKNVLDSIPDPSSEYWGPTLTNAHALITSIEKEGL